MYATEQGILNQQFNTALTAESVELEKKRPFMLLRPRIFPDGDQWCALFTNQGIAEIAQRLLVQLGEVK